MNRFLFHVSGSNRTSWFRYYICDVKVKKVLIESIYQQVNMNTWQTFYMYILGVFFSFAIKNTILNLYQTFCMFILFFSFAIKHPFRDKNKKKMTLQIHLKFNSNECACHTDSFMQCEYEWSISSYYRAWQV